MNTAPLVSVIIPAYGVAPYIAETVGSALAQTYPAFEVIVINDGSPDTPELEAALAPFMDRIIYLRQDNGGVSAARNAGINASKGVLIAFLDGDDLWYPEFLDRQVLFLQHGGFDMVYCNALLSGDHPEDGMLYMQTTPSDGDVTVESLLTHRCQPITSGTVLRRSALVSSGLFNVALRRGQDFELWIRLAHSGARIGYHREVLVRYRIRPNSLSGSPLDRVRRELAVFHAVQGLVATNPTRARIVRDQIAKLEVVQDRELGKAALAAGKYSQARWHFDSAWNRTPTAKLWLVRVAMTLAPGLLRRLFLRFGWRH
jgi:glycosyltransferase involved in cell wall biosynthesis